MRTIPNILVATAIAAISYSAIAQPVHALSFTTTSMGGPLNDSSDGLGIPTNFTFNVSGVAAAPSYNYSLTINGLTHPVLSELEGYLIRSDGATLNLFSFMSLAGNTLTNTTFVDGGASLGDGSAPYTGSFAPENNPVFQGTTIGSFSEFAAVDPNTTWTLRFYDGVNGNTGNLTEATLDITPVPFEFEASGGVLTLGVIFGINKWRKNRVKK